MPSRAEPPGNLGANIICTGMDMDTAYIAHLQGQMYQKDMTHIPETRLSYLKRFIQQ